MAKVELLLIWIHSLPGSSSSSRPVCTSPGCVRAAANLLSAVDRSKSPCEDFYAYACGSWNREHPIPDDMPSFGTFAFVRERVRQQMRVLLEKPEAPGAGGSRSIRMAKTAYQVELGEQISFLGTSLRQGGRSSDWVQLNGDGRGKAPGSGVHKLCDP